MSGKMISRIESSTYLPYSRIERICCLWGDSLEMHHGSSLINLMACVLKASNKHIGLYFVTEPKAMKKHRYGSASNLLI